MESFDSFFFLGQASTLGYKTNHSLSKGAEKRGGRSHWWGMIINKKKSRMENGEIATFSRFIFGNRKQRETYTESENNSQESLEQNEHSTFDSRSNRIADWF